jgi:hypothetical protein
MVMGTASPDALMPTLVNMVAERLRIDGLPTFQLQSGCSGAVQAMSAAHWARAVRSTASWGYATAGPAGFTGGAPLAQLAAAAPSPKYHCPCLGDRADQPFRAGRSLGDLVDGEVIDGEPARP